MIRRRALHISLGFLGLFLLGTVIVLSSVSYYLAIDPSANISEDEVPILDSHQRWNASLNGKIERIPRIFHQTWKSDVLPERWQAVSKSCRDLMPDYDYMLWTDVSSRNFIAQHYSWFLDTFDGYTYPIQRADAIRYFVLYHFGGIYYDLDIGCLRPLDPLLIYPVILPKTIPVGISNDLMLAEKGHPFLNQAIHHLAPFDHSWLLNYPTVMFSTGPMFLSVQYGLYTTLHPNATATDVRILPKSLYGKNAKAHEAPHSFFSHYYGSSWHADDAAFIGFLGQWGKILMWLGLFLLLGGLVKLAMPNGKQRKYALRRLSGYEVLLPLWTQRQGRWHFDLGWFRFAGTASSLPSPVSHPGSPLLHHVHGPDDDMAYIPLLPHALAAAEEDVLPPYPHSPLTEMLIDSDAPADSTQQQQHARNRFMPTHAAAARLPVPQTPTRARRVGVPRGVMLFLQSFWPQSAADVELAPLVPPPLATPPHPPHARLPILQAAPRPLSWRRSSTPRPHSPSSLTSSSPAMIGPPLMPEFGAEDMEYARVLMRLCPSLSEDVVLSRDLHQKTKR